MIEPGPQQKTTHSDPGVAPTRGGGGLTGLHDGVVGQQVDDVLSNVDRAQDPACRKQPPPRVLALSSSWCQDGENSVETEKT